MRSLDRGLRSRLAAGLSARFFGPGGSFRPVRLAPGVHGSPRFLALLVVLLVFVPSLPSGAAPEGSEATAGCPCQAKYSSPTRAKIYLARAREHWPGHPKEAWVWSRIALSFDHGLAEAQALGNEVADFCRAAPDAQGCDFVLRAAAKASMMPGGDQAP